MEIFNIFSVSEPFKTGASGSGLGVPYTIQYNMSVMGTELDGTRYIRNYGKGGNSFNAEAFASNHIYLNGKSVPYPTLASVSFLTYFDSTTNTLKRFGTDIDYGDGLITPSSTYSVTDSHQFVFNHTSPLSAKDVEEIEADPNLAFRMFLDGEVLPSGFSNTDVGWFSGGNEGLASRAFVQDLSVALGANHGILTSSISGTGNTMTDDNIDTFTIHQEVVTLNAYQPVAYNTDSFVADKVFKIVAVVTITNGVGNMRQITYGDANGANTVYTINETVSSGTYTYETVGNRLTDGSINFQIDGTQNATLDATVVFTVQEITSYVEIEDYNSATRTTLANQSKGASNLKLIRDGSGRTTGITVVNTTQWEADGRTAVTNWTITVPFTIGEIINGNPYLFTSNGDRFKNLIFDGTYTIPTGIWTLDEFGFDGVTPVTARGGTGMVNEVIIP